jgi:hypothetical protein
LRWSWSQRVAAEFDPQFLRDMFGPIEEFTTGHPWERRKFLGWRNGERVLLKFAGLGAIGERKLEMARALAGFGFTPEPLGLVHGFLVERWYGDARPLGERDRPVEEIGRYVGARARTLPAADGSGASVDQLLAMCRRNISLALGGNAAAALDHVAVPRSASCIRTDNKLDHEEWLRTADGRLIKTDALDHHQAHDLIGCQPVEWDIAGAIAEFNLDAGEGERLVAAVGIPVDQQLLAFFRIAYAAFRLGHATLAAGIVGSPADVKRLRRCADRYCQSLRLLLHEGTRVHELAGILV